MMFKYNIWHIEQYKNCYNDETNLYAWKFDYEISKIVNKVTKVPRTKIRN